MLGYYFGERAKVLRFEEIEGALSRFDKCPKCSSAEGFWVGLRRGRFYLQCKGCGASFEFFEVYKAEKVDKGERGFRFFRR